MTCSKETAEGIARIAKVYNVPAGHGGLVTVGTTPPKTGRIVGVDQMSLILQDVATGALIKVHPTWKTTYHVESAAPDWATTDHHGTVTAVFPEGDPVDQIQRSMHEAMARDEA